MNARSNSRIRKGSVLNTKYAALSVAWMGEATRLFRFLAMWSTSKVRAFTPQKRGSLFGFRFLGSYGAKSSLSNLFARLWRAKIVAPQACMSICHVLLLGQTFEIFNSIIRFVAINVVNVFVGVKRVQPTFSDYTMCKPFSAKHGVTVRTDAGNIWQKLSENFSATRDGKKVVEESIFDSIYFDANHVVPLCS